MEINEEPEDGALVPEDSKFFDAKIADVLQEMTKTLDKLDKPFIIIVKDYPAVHVVGNMTDYDGGVKQMVNQLRRVADKLEKSFKG